MLQVRIDVEAHAMEAHPMAQPNANTGNFRLANKDPDLPLAAFALDAEARKRGDEPILQRVHEGAHVAAARR